MKCHIGVCLRPCMFLNLQIVDKPFGILIDRGKQSPLDKYLVISLQFTKDKTTQKNVGELTHNINLVRNRLMFPFTKTHGPPLPLQPIIEPN